jgi:hypothetical protein
MHANTHNLDYRRFALFRPLRPGDGFYTIRDSQAENVHPRCRGVEEDSIAGTFTLNKRQRIEKEFLA